MNSKARLRAYNRAVLGWLNNQLTEADIDLLVKTRWLTKEQGEEIKEMPRGNADLIAMYSSSGMA